MHAYYMQCVTCGEGQSIWYSTGMLKSKCLQGFELLASSASTRYRHYRQPLKIPRKSVNNDFKAFGEE
jgi:hypothetical protein